MTTLTTTWRRSKSLENIYFSPKAFNKEPKMVHPFKNHCIEKFEVVTEHLERSQVEALESKMAALPDVDGQLEILCNVLKEADFKAPIWNDADFPLYCLSALKKEMIDGLAFSTSQLFFNVFSHSKTKEDVEIVPLFIDEAVNDLAWGLIKETIEPFSGVQSHFYQQFVKKSKDHYERMNKEQLNNFFEEMRNLPLLDRYLLLIPDPNPICLDLDVDSKETISNMINTNLEVKFNNFCRISDKKENPMRMIPSMGMLKVYLHVMGGENAPILISRYGALSSAALQKGILENELDFFINSSHALASIIPQKTTVKKFDCELCANELEYYGFFQAEIFRRIPKSHRRMFEVCRKILEGIANDADNMNKKNNIIESYKKLYEMEHVIYLNKDVPLEGEARFWIVIALNLHEEAFGEFIHKLMGDRDFYQSEYKISLKGLINTCFEGFQEHIKKDYYSRAMCLQKIAKDYIKERSNSF